MKQTAVIKYTLATRQGWLHQFLEIMDDKTDVYQRDSIVDLFAWTIEELKQYHDIKYGAIEAATTGSQKLMNILEDTYGYSPLEDASDFELGKEGFDYGAETDGFYLPDDQGGYSLTFESSEEEEDEPAKRFKVGNMYVFNFCDKCAKPPKIACSTCDNRYCSRECAE